MSLIVKNGILSVINKNPQAQGVHQFAVTNALVTSQTGKLTKNEIIPSISKHNGQSASYLRSHCVWRVLADKGVLVCSHKKCDCTDKQTMILSGFDDLDESEKNEIRNQANKARRAWEAKQ